MQDINKNKVYLYRSRIHYCTVFILEIGDNPYILIYGEKFSSNFFVNIWYLFKRGTCREVKCEPCTLTLILDEDTRFVENGVVAIKWFLPHFMKR